MKEHAVSGTRKAGAIYVQVPRPLLEKLHKIARNEGHQNISTWVRTILAKETGIPIQAFFMSATHQRSTPVPSQ